MKTLLPACTLIAFSFAAISALAQTPSASSQPASSAAYGKLPLSFEANQGQTDPKIQFLSHGQGYTLFLRPGEAVLALRSGQTAPVDAKPMTRLSSGSDQATSVVTMQLVGANNKAAVSHEDQQVTRTNYFLGSDPANWRTNIPNYGRVRYSSVYPGIDLVYYGNQRQLEHDFVVAPGANPAKIALALKATKGIRSDSSTGDLILDTGDADLRLLKPVTYQEANGHRTEIVSSYKFLANNRIGFSVGPYNHAEPLIIDPVLVYSTYLGGSGTNGNGDQGNGIAVDSMGNAYVVGTTYSTNFPVTSGVFQSTNHAANNGSTVFVSKLNTAGTALLYSTYLGGSGGDFGYGIALDSANNAYVTGATYSKDFPVTCGAILTTNQATTYSGATTGFVTKLTAAGNTLAYSTYLGGSGNQATPAHGDVAQAIAVSSSGNAYVTGYTWSSNFPTTDGALQTNFAGSAVISNAFVSELNPGGTALIYSTFLGGSGSSGAGDYGNAIVLDASGDAFVAGSTASLNFPVTTGAFQTALNGPSTAFVSELNPTGSVAVFSTYLGGSGGDSAQAIATDGNGNIYVAGNTSSSDFPTNGGALEPSTYFPGAPTGFVTWLGLGGSTLYYSTYLEGQGTSVTGMALDGSGNTYITGSARTANSEQFGGFVSTPDALPLPTSSGHSAFLIKLDPQGAFLNYATLIGGSGNDGGNALAIDNSGDVFLTGYAGSTDFPTTANTFQGTNKAASGSSDAFVGKFALASESGQNWYPPPPLIATTLTADVGVDNVSCNGQYDSFFDECDNITLTPSAPGPPPTGDLILYDSQIESGPFNAYPNSTSNAACFNHINPYDFDLSGVYTEEVYGSYTGDQIYAGASVDNIISVQVCPSLAASGLKPSPQKPVLRTPLRLPSMSHALPKNLHMSLTPGRTQVQGPKFIPQSDPSAKSHASITPLSPLPPACQSPLPPLTVTVRSVSRHYGAANPAFRYTITGLLNGDTVTVTPQTAATPASPVGSYPVTVTVTGAAAANYELIVSGTLTVTPAPLTVTLRSVSRLYGAANPALGYFTTGLVNGDIPTVTESTTATPSSPAGSYPVTATVTGAAVSNYTLTIVLGTLYVRPAPLYISASNVASRYGQTPPQPTAYKLTGFVNGDTAAVVSGAPVLSTTVTATTPPGYYKIGVQIGTLTAANYSIKNYSNGEGSVDVVKAPLQLKANNLAMTQGSVVPTLTYTLTGFVNGQSAAGTVAGAPNLSTTATSASAPGHYPININPGTLASTNYFFQAVNGTLTVTP